MDAIEFYKNQDVKEIPSSNTIKPILIILVELVVGIILQPKLLLLERVSILLIV